MGSRATFTGGVGTMRRWRVKVLGEVKVKFVPEDMWVGLYVKSVTNIEGIADPRYTGSMFDAPRTYRRCTRRTYYLCLLPMLPIIWTRSVDRGPVTRDQARHEGWIPREMYR